MLVNAAKAILAMAAAILLLKDIPKDDLNKSLAAISFMGFIVYMLMKGIGYLSMGLAAKSEKIIDNSTKNLLQINSNLGRFAGVAMLVFAVGGSIWLVATALKAVVDASNAMQGNGNIIGGFSAAVQTLTDIIKLVGAIAIALMALTTIKVNLPVIGKFISVNGNGGSNGGAMAAIGVALIGIGVAIASIVAGLVLISKYDIKESAIVAMVGIVSAIVLMTYALGQSARWANTGALLALALDMFVMSVAVGIIIGEVAAISLLMTGASFLGKENVILDAAAAIAIIIVAMGGALGLMSKGLSKMKKPGDIVAPILSMAAVIAVVGWTLKTIAETAGSNLQGTVIAFFAIVAVLGLVATTIDKTVSQVRTGDSSTKTFTALSAIFAAVGACMLMMAIAVKDMASAGSNVGWAILGALGIIALSVAAIASVVQITKKVNASEIAEVLNSVSIAFVAIGASLLLVAFAAQVMTGVDPLAFAAVAGVLGVLLIALIALAVASAKWSGLGDSLKKVASAFQAFGLAILLLGAGSLLFGMSIGIIAGGFGLLANGIGVLAKAFAEHKVTVIILITIIAAIAVVAALLVKACEPIPPLVEKVADAVTTTASKTGSGLLNVLKKSGSNIASWWKKVQPQTKAMIVTGIATLCAAILKATPQVLKTAKALLGKLVGFLIDIIPDAVKAIVAIIIKLVNALANEIRSNSAKIAFAIWNLLEALLEVVLEVVGQMILMLTGTSGPFGKLGQKLVDGLSGTKGLLRKNLAEVEAYAEEADDLANKYKNDFLSFDAEDGDPWAEKAQEIQAMREEMEETEAQAKKTQNAVNGADYYAQVNSNKNQKENEKAGAGIMDAVQNGMDSMGLNVDSSNLNFQNPQDMLSDYQDDMNIGTMMTDEMLESKGELYDASAETVQEGPVDAIADSEVDVRKAVKDHITGIVMNEIKDQGFRNSLKTNAYVNGTYVVDGYVEGITKNKGRVVTVMEQLAWLTNDKFQGPMKINSPSKVFFQNGEFILEGLANGMLSSMGLVKDASGQLSTTIMDSFGAPLDYAQRVASGELVYDPTIRPVLDSSSIGRGAGAINSMFRNQNVSLSGFSGQLAADIGQLDSRNSDVVEELRALREEMSIMGEEISNMQVVMDTGALVGATAGPMDKALGQRAVRFGRGN